MYWDYSEPLSALKPHRVLAINRGERERERTSGERPSGERLPVIALTAYALKGDKEKFLALGFDGYVSKPLEVKKLIAEMRRVLELP